jgi:tetratricopeptide (TPR) repeat protein
MPNLFVPRKFVRLAVAASWSLLLALICQASGRPSLVSFPIENQNDPAVAHLERGLRLAQAGELQAAEAELRSAVKLKPDDAEFLSGLATVLAIEKKFDESTSWFEKALKSNPADLRSRRHLAANLWQLRRYAEAKQHLKIILKADPADAQAKLLLGMVSEKSGDHATAVAMFEAVPELVRSQPEAAVALAKSYYRTGERTKAADFLSALATGPLQAQGALLGAQVADDMQDYETAKTLLGVIPAESSAGAAARYRLAVVEFHTRQYEQSEQVLQQLIGAGRKNGEILRLLGWCYHRTNRDEDAIRTFREAVELNPTDERNFLDLGGLLLEQRKFTAAMELANRSVNAFPASADALALLGSIELATERFTDALKTFSRSLSLDPSNPEGILGLARAQAGAGMGDHAKRTLDEAIQRFPGKAPFEVELALLLLKEDEGGNADSQARCEQLLQAAAKHDPTLAEAQFQLGELALRRGQTALGIAHLENAVRISPESARAHFALARGYRRAGRAEEAAKETALFEKFKNGDSRNATSLPPNVPPGE